MIVCMCRRFMCYVLRATQNFHENLSHLCIIALFILPNTHTFCSQQMTKSHHRSIYNNCLSWLYRFETQLQPLSCNSINLGYTQRNSHFTFFNQHKQLYWPKKWTPNWTEPELNWIKRRTKKNKRKETNIAEITTIIIKCEESNYKQIKLMKLKIGTPAKPQLNE